MIECGISFRFADGAKMKSFRCLPTLTWESSELCYCKFSQSKEWCSVLKKLFILIDVGESVFLYFLCWKSWNLSNDIMNCLLVIFLMVLRNTVRVCQRLRTPRNGQISTDLAIEGTIVDVKCLPGFMFADRSTAMSTSCNSTFLWTETINDCDSKQWIFIPWLYLGYFS